MAGRSWATRHFPVRIGRAAEDDLCLEEDGVWEGHLTIQLDSAGGIILTPRLEAPVTVNQQPTRSCVLRNGDSIEIGSARLRFWLAELPRRGLRIREALVWVFILAICLVQIAIIYVLLT